MSVRLYTPVYALTLLISAALLFSVQPMFSKMILPLLGGTPQVWNTAMLFFQVCLLGGYAYAHGTSRYLGIRAQAGLHIVLLSIFVVVLPFAIPDGWVPPVDRDPTLWQMSLMAITVGGPFFVLAGSAPMLQRWFSHTDHPDAHNPYFLYGASNLGSMSALLAYPVVIEPLLTLDMQSYSWMLGYFGLIAFMVLAAGLVWKPAQTGQNVPAHHQDAPPVRWSDRLSWVFLAFVPSSLMLGVTTFITTDIASVPLLWIVPLAIYVGTFILVFARKVLLKEQHVRIGFDVFLVLMIFTAFNPVLTIDYSNLAIALHLFLFFFAAMVCHTALARSRPHSAHLTEFYLLMSFGGALGGFFNAIIAPQFFVLPLEYALVLGLAIFARYFLKPEYSAKHFIRALRDNVKTQGLNAIFTLNGLSVFIVLIACIFAFGIPNSDIALACSLLLIVPMLFLSKTRWQFALAMLIVLSLFPPGFNWGQHFYKDLVVRDRNFFGVIRVADTIANERILLHGTTNHGMQPLLEDHRLTPLSYYSEHSPIHGVFSYFDSINRPQNVSVVGLGIGVMACLSHKDRHFDFFEIDPDIADIASNPDYFTYLSDCGSSYDIILGDGRLTLQDKPDGSYDIITMDAFSSDNIPVHLITIEAIELYLQKLKDGGVVVFNISNRHLNLEPLLAAAADKLGLYGLASLSPGGEMPDIEFHYYPAHFFVLTKSKAVKAHLEAEGWEAARRKYGLKVWTDQYSNIVSVLGNTVSKQRFKELKAEKEAQEQDEQP